MVRGGWIIASSGGVDADTLDPRQSEGYIGFESLDGIYGAVTERKPSYIAVDAIMPGGDAGALAKRVSMTDMETMPIMLVLTPDVTRDFARDITSHVQVRAILDKPVTGPMLTAAVRGAGAGDRLSRLGNDKSSVARLLWKLGFSPAVCGFDYALTAVDLVSRDMRLVRSMSLKLYPEIARMYRTDAGSVESAVRRAMDSAWSSGSPKTQYALFANTIDECRGKPTIAQLFACIAERLYSGMEIDI